MKKRAINEIFIVVLSALIYISCSTEDETVDPFISIPDQNFETILISQGIDSDGTLNGEILRADAEKVTLLDLNLNDPIEKVSDLTGIEGFVNLTKLSAFDHDIESIDLSRNTKLQNLDLQLNYLTHIDLSKNPNVDTVNLHFNELQSISGLSNVTNLKRLDLSWNFLEDFTIQNESLVDLFVNNNLLKSFNAQGSTSLKNLLMGSNELESLDLSTNVAIETLIISANNLENIHVGQLENLTWFYASANSLTSLDVSNNEKLVDLRVHNNPNLTCIKIGPGQEIPTVMKPDGAQLNSDCN